MPERDAALGTWIKRFLMEHLPTERNLAVNTRKSYRDSLTLLLPFVARALRQGGGTPQGRGPVRRPRDGLSRPPGNRNGAAPCRPATSASPRSGPSPAMS